MAKGRPSTALSVSNTPSPTVRPWSKSETVASSAVAPATPFSHTRPSVTASDPDATRSRWRAFSSVSSHSSAGSLSQVMPPPVPKWSCAVLDPERADGDVEVALLAVGVDPADGAAVDAARHRLERGDVLERGELRRAGDRARRERGARWRRPSRSRAAAGPRTVRHEVDEARGACSTREQRGHLDRAELAHPAEVVADEVDDHHVLGPVLGQ